MCYFHTSSIDYLREKEVYEKNMNLLTRLVNAGHITLEEAMELAPAKPVEPVLLNPDPIVSPPWTINPGTGVNPYQIPTYGEPLTSSLHINHLNDSKLSALNCNGTTITMTSNHN